MGINRLRTTLDAMLINKIDTQFSPGSLGNESGEHVRQSTAAETRMGFVLGSRAAGTEHGCQSQWCIYE
jgi:hypothetical protein